MAGRLDSDSLLLLSDALARLEQGFVHLPDHAAGVGDAAALREALLAAAERLRDNYPYFHPQYAGQMLKPPHPVARLAYALAMWINPNNHALDGGRASSAMEKEAVAEIARMFGWDTHLGHLTSGGTMANLEALWIAGELAPGRTVLASSQAHYTHGRISAVLKLPFEAVPADRFGRMDLDALSRRLEAGGVGTVVATLGTTATGAVDPLPGILSLRERHGFRLHVDCAYGGYYTLAGNLEPAIVPQSGGSICNDIFTDILGMPTIWIPHSYASCSQHAPDEHILLPITRSAIELMAGLYWDIGEGGTPAAGVS